MISHTQNTTVYYKYVSIKIIIYKNVIKSTFSWSLWGVWITAVVVNIRKYVVSEYTLREHLPLSNSQNSRIRAGFWQYWAMQINVIPHSITYIWTQLRKCSQPTSP